MSKNLSEFINVFKAIAPHNNRYDVFRDFVTMATCSLHNSVNFDQAMEDEYLQLARKYDPDDLNMFSYLLAEVVLALGRQPSDILGSAFMALELGSENIGQYFTPYDVSRMMIQMTIGNDFSFPKGRDFLTLSEPACGAGGMVIAFAEILTEAGYNPQKQLWVSCWDVDPIAAKMCYIQLSLLNIPAEIVVGNTLSLNYQRVMYTPAHYLGLWDLKLRGNKDSKPHSVDEQSFTLRTAV